MKIGILTAHYPLNYGAVLQAFALQEHLKELGHTVTIINYRSKYLHKQFSVLNIENILQSRNILAFIKLCIVRCIIIPKRFIRLCSFNKFSKSKLNLSKIVKADSIPSDFDVYILGSDQIWNSEVFGGFDTVYFGDFPVTKGSKIVSYAASMSTAPLTAEQQDFFVKELKRIDVISVRESILSDTLQPLSDKKIYTVLDPTLLLSSFHWDAFLSKPVKKGKYILLYQVRYSPASVTIAQDIARQLNGDVIEIAPTVNNWRIRKNNIQGAGPDTFIRLIKYASCIVTTSFHGTVFSVIFNKPFYSLKLNDDRDSRVACLLESLGLSDRFITEDKRPAFSKIDYTKANVALDNLRKISNQYIQNAITDNP
jgi:hypothetical protein